LPTARSRDRFTAARAMVTLYSFMESGVALLRAMSPMLPAMSSSRRWPTRARAASWAIHGVGATWPITMRASRTKSPSVCRQTAAAA